MSDSESYQTKLLGNFRRSYKKLLRTHYRKNRKAKDDFENLVENLLTAMRADPRPPPPFAHTEPWPGRSAREGFELWKLDFKMPKLKGASKEGRVIYLIDEASRVVYFVWIYTHEEFPGRPPDKDLQRILKQLFK